VPLKYGAQEPKSMAEIRSYPFVRHLRSDASAHVVHYRRSRVRHSARGASFWFDPLNDSLAEVPLDDRELQLVIHGRSRDFQDLTAQGTMTYRLTDPVRIADRYDFTIDLASGKPLGTPIDKLESMLAELAQQHAQSYLAQTDLRPALVEGALRTRTAIEAALAGDAALRDAGIAIVSVRVHQIRPTADLEKAIEAPTRERIKQEADEAAYGRRALAVEKERAIAENELQNRIELAKREEYLIAQSGANDRAKAEYASEAASIASASEAASISAVEGARLTIERQKIEAYGVVPPAVMLGLAVREFAGKIEHIGNVTLTPDLVGPYLASILRPQGVR
jgi:regulator of protease activity HflC (stomatin/prohibitin superfamily)